MALRTLQNNAMSFTENQHGNVILEKLRQQREEEKFCDVILLVQDREFPAHRNVLSACSAYFESVLKVNRIVKEQMRITCLKSNNHEVFTCLLNYMYTGSVVIDKDNVAELLRLANHFLISKVKNYCAEYLDRYLNISNCLGVKELADKYQMPALSRTANAFMVTHFDQILTQEEIPNLNLSQLERLITDEAVHLSTEEQLRLMSHWVGHDPLNREREMGTLLTYVDWRKVDPSWITRYIEEERLFQDSQRALYFLLQSLMHSNLPIAARLQKIFLSLYSKDSTEDRYENFLNLAVSSAIGDFQEPDHSATHKAKVSLEDIELYNCSGVDGGDERQPNLHVLHAPLPEDFDAPVNLKTESLLKEQKYKLGKVRMATTSPSSSEINYPISKEDRRDENGHYDHSHVWVAPHQGIETAKNSEQVHDTPQEDFYPPYQNNHYNNITPPECEELTVPQRPPVRKSQIKERSKKSSYACDKCSYAGSSKASFDAHMRKVHEIDVTYSCFLCSFTCKWSREYYAHVRNHFPGPPYHCQACRYSTERIQYFIAHRMKHTDERPYSCPNCAYRSRSKFNLECHMRSHMGQHYAKHSNLRPFLCDICGFSAKYRNHLVQHKKTHTGEVFKCQFENCHYSTPRRALFICHMRQHLAIRSFTCSTCARAFVTKAHLVRHEKTHRKDRPYTCSHCDFASARLDKLRDHVSRHHGEKPTARTPYKSRKSRKSRPPKISTPVEYETRGPETYEVPIEDITVMEDSQHQHHDEHQQELNLEPHSPSTPPENLSLARPSSRAEYDHRDANILNYGPLDPPGHITAVAENPPQQSAHDFSGLNALMYLL
ncbi:unnamed protein product [Darwinula stevensoni]|uniref:Uncharacterized protein n=1 Tax=Darwinula stevensoni TaxID=69355 RepID=A0A7R9ACA5_9CRUS|nr:unnamed protein product [Darwinula stevensoni]CAG0899994.1 unnamed protein product [Darwinula stevensoni]